MPGLRRGRGRPPSAPPGAAAAAGGGARWGAVTLDPDRAQRGDVPASRRSRRRAGSSPLDNTAPRCSTRSPSARSRSPTASGGGCSRRRSCTSARCTWPSTCWPLLRVRLRAGAGARPVAVPGALPASPRWAARSRSSCSATRCVPVAGASTAIYGLLGALGVLMLARRQDVRGLLTLLAINVVISFLPGVSLLGHLGGLVAGAAAAGARWWSPGAARRCRSPALAASASSCSRWSSAVRRGGPGHLAGGSSARSARATSSGSAPRSRRPSRTSTPSSSGPAAVSSSSVRLRTPSRRVSRTRTRSTGQGRCRRAATSGLDAVRPAESRGRGRRVRDGQQQDQQRRRADQDPARGVEERGRPGRAPGPAAEDDGLAGAW